MSKITILHVDDDPRLGDLVAEFLERENTRFTVVTETSASDGLDHIEAETPDCVISDYDMPGQNGLDFLNAVRDTYPDLPFILFTGKGSEEVASAAISAGATDYLQKESGTDQYTILANRVQNTVEQYRSQKELERERSRMKFALQSTDAAIWTHDIETDEMDIYPDICPVFNTSIESLDGWIRQLHPEDRANAEQTIRGAARAKESYSLQFRFTAESGTRWGEMNGRTIKEDGDATFQTGITRDITEQKEQKRRFETLASNLPGMVYRCKNEPSWPMQDVRGDVAGFSGYTATELESNATQWGQEVIHPDGRDKVWDTVQESLETGESFEVTYRIRTKSGDIRWVWERGRGVYGPDDDVEALEGFITDITNRKQRAEELRQNERRFKAVFNDPNILVALLDLEGTVQHINKTALEYVEADRDEVRGEKFWHTTWWTSETVADLKEWIDQATDGEYVDYEVNHPASNGDVFTVEGTIRPVTDEKGDVVSLIASAHDITEQERHKEELELIRDKIEVALAGTDSVIWELDPETGDMQTHPEPCPVLDGVVESVAEFKERVYPANREQITEALQSVMETGGPQTIQFRTVPEIEAEWVESKIQRLTRDDGSIVLIGFSRGITDYKRRERQLEQQNEQFDELASVVSHDLQTPIQTLQGRLELAAGTGEIAHIDDALAAVNQLNKLRENLVEMLQTREVVGETEQVNIGDIARDAWKRVNSSDCSTLEVADTVYIQADQDATQRLLQNLLSNSVEHTEDETTVQIGTTANGFYVEDDGPGIDPSDREEVFTPGFTTKAGGTGMGMVSVRQIIAAHDWEIEITDAETLSGVRFEIQTTR